MNPSTSQLLSELSKEWNRIERRAKEIESFRGEAIVAAINEMRYTGRRVIDFLASQEDETARANAHEHLIVARTYLMNADHDLTDSVIFVVHQRVSLAEKKYGRDKVEKLCPSFKEMYPAIVEAQAIVMASRENRHERAEAYRKLADEYVPKLMALHKEMVAASALRIDQLSLLEKNVRIVGWISFVGSVASIVGIALGIWGIALSWPTEATGTPPTTLEAPVVPPQP